jgi:hypothetical protein
VRLAHEALLNHGVEEAQQPVVEAAGIEHRERLPVIRAYEPPRVIKWVKAEER